VILRVFRIDLPDFKRFTDASRSKPLCVAYMMKKLFQFLLFFGLGITILTLVFRNQNAAFQEQCRLDGTPAGQCSLSAKLLNDFSSVHLGWILAVVLAFTVSNVFRALRWQMLLAPMGHQVRFSNSFFTILLGYFANLGFPRMGEVVRAGALARYEPLPIEHSMGTLVIDRLMDFICLCLVVALAFVLEGDVLLRFFSQGKNGAESGTSWAVLLSSPVVLLLFGLFAIGCVIVFSLRKKLAQTIVFQKVASLAQGFWEGFRSVFRLKNPALFLLYSLGIWLMFYFQCYFNLQAFAPTAHLGASAALMVFVFGTLGFVIPSPGGMGTFHALCIAGLGLYGVSGSDGFSYANIAFFTVQIFYNLLGGTLALVLLPMLNKRAPGQSGMLSR